MTAINKTPAKRPAGDIYDEKREVLMTFKNLFF